MTASTKYTTFELNSLYVIGSIFSGGRLFVGAISVLYILSYGIGISDFALIKSLQVATFLIFDIPSGLYIKRFGYKNSLITAFVLSILGLAIYLCGSNFTTFLVAEFVTALSLCLFPTAFTDYTMSFLNKNPNILVEKVFHKSDMFASLAALICGGLGGYVFNINKTLPYFSGIALHLIAFYFIFKINDSQFSDSKKNTSTLLSLKSVFSGSSFMSMYLFIPVLTLFVIQLTVQPLYHYWQPLFFEIDNNVSGSLLGLVFSAYSLCSIILNLIFSKISKNEYFRSYNCVFVMLLISTLFYFISAISNSILITLTSFTLLQGILFTSLTCISAIINRHIDDSQRPITLKLISFFSRIGMLISFGCIKIFSEISTHNLYLLSACTLLIAIVLIRLIEYRYFKINTFIEVKIENAI